MEIYQHLNEAPVQDPFTNEQYEVPEKSGDEELPPPELKPLPKELRYELLDKINKYSFTIIANLSDEEKVRLMKTFKRHRKAFGYSMDDLKGISPSICTHRIYMEEGVVPVHEYQRKFNSEIKEVVRKEIIHLLNAGIIYPVFENKWGKCSSLCA